MKKIPFTFRYLLPPGQRTLPPTATQNMELFPLIPITLYTDARKSPPMEGLLDSGANGLFIPKPIAEYLELSLSGPVQSGGVDGLFKAHATKVGVIIGRGGRTVDFGTITGIVPDEHKDVPILIGRHPLFDEYQIVFEEYRKVFHLIPKEEASKK